MTRAKLITYMLGMNVIFFLLLAILPPTAAESLGWFYLSCLSWIFTLFLLFGATAYVLFFLASAFRS